MAFDHRQDFLHVAGEDEGDEDDLDVLARTPSQLFPHFEVGEELDVVGLVGFELEELSQECPHDLHELVDVDFLEVVLGEGLGQEGVHEEVQLPAVLVGSGEDHEGVLGVAHRRLVVF